MVHQSVERLMELRAGAGHAQQLLFSSVSSNVTRQQCLVRVHSAPGGQPGTKRARPVPVNPGTPYLKSATFGGRGNFLPVEAPVIFKRSLIMPQLRDVPGREPEILSKVACPRCMCLSICLCW